MKKDLVKWGLAALLFYNVIPILNLIVPDAYFYTFLLDLWVLNPIAALGCSFFFCKKYGAKWWIAAVLAVLFVPSIFIFYNSSAGVFVLVYLLCAGIGCILGWLMHRNRQKSDEAK